MLVFQYGDTFPEGILISRSRYPANFGICVMRQLSAQRFTTRAVLRLEWPSILLQSARDRVATASETVTASRLLWIVHGCLAKRWRHLSDFDCIVVVRHLMD